MIRKCRAGRSAVGPTLTKLIDVVVPSMSNSKILHFFTMSPISLFSLAISTLQHLLLTQYFREILYFYLTRNSFHATLQAAPREKALIEKIMTRELGKQPAGKLTADARLVGERDGQNNLYKGQKEIDNGSFYTTNMKLL